MSAIETLDVSARGSDSVVGRGRGRVRRGLGIGIGLRAGTGRAGSRAGGLVDEARRDLRGDHRDGQDPDGHDERGRDLAAGGDGEVVAVADGGDGGDRPPDRLAQRVDVAALGVAFVEVDDDGEVEGQHRRREQEPPEAAAEEDRLHQAEAEDHPHRREEHDHQAQRMGADVVPVPAGQVGADGQVDAVDDRQRDAHERGEGRPVVVRSEVARWDEDDPQRQQRQQVERGGGARHVGAEPAGRVVGVGGAGRVRSGVRCRPRAWSCP